MIILGNKPQNGGALGRMLMQSKGTFKENYSCNDFLFVFENLFSLTVFSQGVGRALGAQNGHGGYPTKGQSK